MLVERRGWLTEHEFAEMLSLGQFLPGPNIVNVSVMVGRKFHGVRGAFAAVAGLMLMPMAIVMTLGALYAQFAELAVVRDAMGGIAAAASGLVLAMGFKMARAIRTRPVAIAVARSRSPRSASCAAAAGLGAGGDGADRHRARVVETPLMPSALFELALQFLTLSLLSFGGANAALPDIHRRVVDVHGWMTNTEFTQMFALSQAAPGPNVLVVALIGWKVAGVIGGIVAMTAMCAPSSVLTYLVAHASDRFREAPLRVAIQNGLVPVTVGLIVASGYVLTVNTDHGVAAYVVTLVTFAVVLFTRVHPLWMLAAGGVAGALGWLAP